MSADHVRERFSACQVDFMAYSSIPRIVSALSSLFCPVDLKLMTSGNARGKSDIDVVSYSREKLKDR